MLLLLLLLPFATFGSIAPNNQFIPVTLPDDWQSPKRNFARYQDFVIPEYNNGENGPDQPGGLKTEDIYTIRTLLGNYKARLFFPTYNSITYFLTYVIDNVNVTVMGDYSQLISTIDLNDPNAFAMYSITDEDKRHNTFFNQLLQALEKASNEVSISPPEIFFQRAVQIMRETNDHKPIAVNGPKNTILSSNKNNNSVFDRLKRAFIFEWKTFRVPCAQWNTEQKGEYIENLS